MNSPIPTVHKSSVPELYTLYKYAHMSSSYRCKSGLLI